MEATLKEVNDLKLKKSRPRIKMRFTKKRYEFTNDVRNLIDKDGGEGTAPDQKPKNLKN